MTRSGFMVAYHYILCPFSPRLFFSLQNRSPSTTIDNHLKQLHVSIFKLYFTPTMSFYYQYFINIILFSSRWGSQKLVKIVCQWKSEWQIWKGYGSVTLHNVVNSSFLQFLDNFEEGLKRHKLFNKRPTKQSSETFRIEFYLEVNSHREFSRNFQ